LPWLWSAEPAKKLDARPSVEQLIEQLGSKDFKTREAAGQALEARGVEILSALRKAQDHSDPEVRRRLEAMIPTLETISTLSPKLVTLDLVNRPLKDAIQEVAKQTGYKIIYPEGQVNPRGEKLLYTFQMKQATFWEALDKICDASGLQLQHGYGDDQFRLYFQDYHAPYVYRTDPFRLVAER